MKKIMILLFIVGGLIMLRPVDTFMKNIVGDIMYRRNLNIGIVKVVNADKSFNVEIAESGKIHKNIFTLSPDPDLAVDDKVRILYNGGNIDDPILLAPTRPTVIPNVRYALIVASPNAFQLFDMEGVLLTQLAVLGWAYSGCAITLDAVGNIYTDEDGEVLKKYDSNFNILVTKDVEDDNWVETINAGPDGFIYTLELLDEGYDIKKRNASDLTIAGVIPITDEIYYSYEGALGIDSSGNFYVYQNPYVEKYSSGGVLLAQLDVGNLNNGYAGAAVCGNYVYFVQGTNKVYYIPLNLSTYNTWNVPSSNAYSLTVADGYIILSGFGTTSKYDSSRNLIWTKASQSAYKAGGYNF